jgi:hypothetical protein
MQLCASYERYSNAPWESALSVLATAKDTRISRVVSLLREKIVQAQASCTAVVVESLVARARTFFCSMDVAGV